MPRPMSTEMATALAASELFPAIFIEATFNSGTVYLWTGSQPIEWNSQTWQGVGDLGSVSVIDEGTNVEAKGITLTLSGFNSDLLADVWGEFNLGSPVIVRLGLFNDGVLIDNPIVSWAGRMDLPAITISGETATIELNCESRLIEMNVPVDRRYTAEDQQREWPGDLGFQFVSQIQEKALFFGSSPTVTQNV